MSDTRFTPGSWEVRKEIDGLHEGWKTWVCSGKRGVAVCNNQTRGSTFNAGRSEAEANAHLIAAAPDGYELSRLVIDICGNPKGISEVGQEQLYEAALQYQKKARGES